MSDGDKGEYVDLAYERRLRAYPRQEAGRSRVYTTDERVASLERDVIFLNAQLLETNNALLRIVTEISFGRSPQGVAHPQGDGEGQKETGA